MINSSGSNIFQCQKVSGRRESHCVKVTCHYIDSIVGFVTCSSEGKWWLACVLNQEESTVNLTFLHPNGPSNSFKYPEQQFHLRSIMIPFVPHTRTSRVYTLSKNEVTAASKALLTET